MGKLNLYLRAQFSGFDAPAELFLWMHSHPVEPGKWAPMRYRSDIVRDEAYDGITRVSCVFIFAVA